MKHEKFPKISVTVITYNQEELIKRALDSVLIQKEWVYEIIVCDDCSTDNNWSVILEYAKRYPDLIKPYRNEKNLGIFGNIENTWSKTTGDAVIFLSGDDELCEKLFFHVNKAVEKMGIDFMNESSCLYMDYKVEYPTPKMNFLGKLFGNKPKNNFIQKGFDPISLKIRGLIVNRTVIYSNSIQKKFSPVPKDMGIFADGLIDIQLQQFTEKNYYYPYIGSVYFAKIGISVKITPKDSYLSRSKLGEAYKKRFELSEKDIAWLDFINARNDFFLTPSVSGFINIVKFHIKSIELKYGFKGLQFRIFFTDVWRFLDFLFIRNNHFR
ncbi:MAG: glycosyltransferase family 2 protein [Paludibacter sp.]|nr:glycosyltransferase family 2 protein [Paludibacter sp.]